MILLSFHERSSLSRHIAIPSSQIERLQTGEDVESWESRGGCWPYSGVERAMIAQTARRRPLVSVVFTAPSRRKGLRRCPSARPGLASARATRVEGDRPPLRAARRVGLHKRMTGRDDSGSEEARKTGETARVGAGVCRRFILVRARGGAAKRHPAMAAAKTSPRPKAHASTRRVLRWSSRPSVAPSYKFDESLQGGRNLSTTGKKEVKAAVFGQLRLVKKGDEVPVANKGLNKNSESVGNA